MTATGEDTLLGRFLEFHRQHPEVYKVLVGLARSAKRRGHDKLGIGMLYEVARWELMLRTDDPEGYKLNNNWRAFYARLIMAREPDLRGIFDTRVQRAAERVHAPDDAEGRLFT